MLNKNKEIVERDEFFELILKNYQHPRVTFEVVRFVDQDTEHFDYVPSFEVRFTKGKHYHVIHSCWGETSDDVIDCFFKELNEKKKKGQG
jgi:hypothetical protein